MQEVKKFVEDFLLGTGHLGLCYCIISVPPDEKPVLGFLS